MRCNSSVIDDDSAWSSREQRYARKRKMFRQWSIPLPGRHSMTIFKGSCHAISGQFEAVDSDLFRWRLVEACRETSPLSRKSRTGAQESRARRRAPPRLSEKKVAGRGFYPAPGSGRGGRLQASGMPASSVQEIPEHLEIPVTPALLHVMHTLSMKEDLSGIGVGETTTAVRFPLVHLLLSVSTLQLRRYRLA
jgi:hypothetical protein